MRFFSKELFILRLRRFPTLSLLVTVGIPMALFFGPKFVADVPSDFGAEPILPSSKIATFVWDDSWRSRRGRLMPDANDWQMILDAVSVAGVRSLVVADENVFSRNQAAEPGYVDVFQRAKEAGIAIYAPVRLATHGESFRSVNTARLGMPIELLVLDESSSQDHHGAVTTVRDLRVIPQLKGEMVVGPASEFLDVLAGVGLISADFSTLVPVYRWREDRFIADLALAPRDTSTAVGILGGDITVNETPLAVNDDGAVALPNLRRSASYSGNLDAIRRARGAEMIVVGPAGSPYLDRLVGIANAASHGHLPTSSNWRDFGLMMLLAVIGAFIARLHSVGLALAIGFSVGLTLALFPKMFIPDAGWAEWLGFSLPAAFMIPFGFEVIRRAFRRDRRIQYVARKMTEFELEKLAMARQARMLVHDLRRLIKPDASGASDYLEGFLAEFAALDGGGRAAVVESLSIVTLVRAQLSQAEAALERRQLKCVMRWRHRSRIAGDSVNVRRIIDNLLMNAIAASPIAGVISVSSSEEVVDLPDGAKLCCVLRFENSVTTDGRDIVFSVLDTDRSRDRSRESFDSGSGLGLIIVHRLVTALGGSVTGQFVSAEDSSRKALVVVALPVDKMLVDTNVLSIFGSRYDQDNGDNGDLVAGDLSDQMSRQTDDEKTLRGEFRPMIIVDDSPFVRDFWERQARNYEVFSVKAPSELLELLAPIDGLRARRPLVIMDYHFEGSMLDGVTTAKKLMAMQVFDVVICSDWDLGPLELKNLQVPVIKKSEATLEKVLASLAVPLTRD